MLNELKNPSAARTRDAIEATKELIEEPRIDPDRKARILVEEMEKGRNLIIEKCRSKMIDLYEEEAWRCAFRWAAMTHDELPPAPVNMAMGTAVAVLNVLDTLKNDGVSIFVAYAFQEDRRGYAMPCELTLARPEDLS